MITCPIIAVLHHRFGYRSVFKALMVLNCSMAILAFAIGENDGVDTSLDRVLYYVTIVGDSGQMVMTIASVPKTFGIKYGCVVLVFVLTSRVFVMLSILVFPHSAFSIYIAGIVAAIIAFGIAHFFQEKLDIKNMVERKMVVF